MQDHIPIDKLSEADFRAYEAVRRGGKHNMWTPRARKASGLAPDVFAAVQRAYLALAAKYPEVVAK